MLVRCKRAADLPAIPFALGQSRAPEHRVMIAAIDRLVHHSIIFEMNVESYRRRGALERKNRSLVAPSPRSGTCATSELSSLTTAARK